MYKTAETAELIAQTAGRFFAVEFIRKDGTKRAMVARVGVRKFVTGEGLRFDPASRGLAVVWEPAKGYRMVSLDRLLSLRCGDIQWRANANS